MSNKDYDEIHTCSNPEVIYSFVKGLYRVAMHEQQVGPSIMAAIEMRVEELKNE